MSARALTTLLCILAAGAFAALADAAMAGGGPVTITALSQGSATCRLSANDEALRRVRTINAHHVEFEFTVAGRAHPGRYVVTAKCGAQRESTRAAPAASTSSTCALT